jgi:signal transduction histidine kinase
MKKKKLSLLYFFLLLNCFHFTTINAEQKKDSLWFHYNLFTKAKGSNDLIKAYKFYEKHKIYSLKNNDTLGAISDLRYIASIQKKLGAENDSELSAVEAIKLLDDLGTSTKATKEARIGLYNHLGIIYRVTNNYEKALEYYNKILELATQPNHINTILNNIAYIFLNQKKYEKAKMAFTEVYNNSQKLKNEKQTARALSNLGFVKFKLKESDALKVLNEALDIRKKINHVSGIYSSYIYITEYYIDYNQKQKALKFANLALNIGQELNNVKYKVEALSSIVLLDKNPKIIEYKKLTDSIASVKQLNENRFASMKYDFSKEKIKLEEAKVKLVESQLEEEKEKRLKLAYQGITAFIFFLLVSSYFIFKARNKRDKLEQIYKTETHISRKVHDEVANEVYHVITKLQKPTLNINEEILDDLESIYNKTRDISKEHSDIDVKNNFYELLNDLLISYKSESINIITKNISKINWKTLSSDKKTTVYRALQELMTNMKKHSNATIVVLVFSQKNKEIMISYSDNGVGGMIKKGAGLHNVETRINAVNGTITFEPENTKGFKAKITI